jgi:hypothetical protein
MAMVLEMIETHHVVMDAVRDMMWARGKLIIYTH